MFPQETLVLQVRLLLGSSDLLPAPVEEGVGLPELVRLQLMNREDFKGSWTFFRETFLSHFQKVA